MTTEAERYEAVTFYANIAKRKKYGRNVPVLVSTTTDGPSKAAHVIASVRVEVRVPRRFLVDGPPTFSARLDMHGDPRETEIVSIDMLEEIVPPLEVLRPAQEPAE